MTYTIDHVVLTTADIDKCVDFYVNDPDGNLIEIGNYSSEVKLLY